MSTPRTPDELTAENEQICEKLLGWKKLDRDGPWKSGWYAENGDFMGESTPAFDTWADVGAILEALSKQGRGPLTLRATALSYIRSLP